MVGPRGIRFMCFNPRSHAGSDEMECGGAFLVISFNPRSHAGSDKDNKDEAKKLNVSIHAPTRGATRLDIGAYWGYQCFNPRSHAGSDQLV